MYRRHSETECTFPDALDAAGWVAQQFAEAGDDIDPSSYAVIAPRPGHVVSVDRWKATVYIDTTHDPGASDGSDLPQSRGM